VPGDVVSRRLRGSLDLLNFLLADVRDGLGPYLSIYLLITHRRAQLVMVPVAYLAGAKADAWGRKPIFLLGFAVLTARGLLYTLSDN